MRDLDYAQGELLYRPSSRRILAALRDDWRTLTELADELEIKKPSVHRTLAPLIDAGFVEAEARTTAVGRERAYRAIPFDLSWTSRDGMTLHWVKPGQLPNGSRLLYQIPGGTARDDLETILRILEKQTAPIRRAIQFVILYGSAARGESTWKSDIDLLLVVEGDVARVDAVVRERLADPRIQLHHAVHARSASLEEVRESTDPLMLEVRDEGVIIQGEFDGEGGVWTRMKRYNATLR